MASLQQRKQTKTLNNSFSFSASVDHKYQDFRVEKNSLEPPYSTNYENQVKWVKGTHLARELQEQNYRRRLLSPQTSILCLSQAVSSCWNALPYHPFCISQHSIKSQDSLQLHLWKALPGLSRPHPTKNSDCSPSSL